MWGKSDENTTHIFPQFIPRNKLFEFPEISASDQCAGCFQWWLAANRIARSVGRHKTNEPYRVNPTTAVIGI